MKKTPTVLTVNDAQKKLDAAKAQYGKTLTREVIALTKDADKRAKQKEKLNTQKEKAGERKVAAQAKHKTKPTKATKAAFEKARDAAKAPTLALAVLAKEVAIANEKLAGVKYIEKQMQAEEKVLEKFRKEQVKLVAKKARSQKKVNRVARPKAKIAAQKTAN